MHSSLPHSQTMLIVPVIVPKASFTPSIWSFTFRKRSSFRPIRSARASTSEAMLLGVPSSRRFRKGGRDGGEAASVLEPVGGGGRSPVLAGAGGAPGAGGRVRGRASAGPQEHARRG